MVMKQITFLFCYSLSLYYSICGYWTYESTKRGLEGYAASVATRSTEEWGAPSVRVLGRWRQSSVSAAIVCGSLMLEVVVTVLTNTHWRRNPQSFDLRLEATAPAKQGKTNENVKKRYGDNSGCDTIKTAKQIVVFNPRTLTITPHKCSSICIIQWKCAHTK